MASRFLLGEDWARIRAAAGLQRDALSNWFGWLVSARLIPAARAPPSTADYTEIALQAFAICKVADGRIVALDEYQDPAQIGAALSAVVQHVIPPLRIAHSLAL
ncbi:hypothetical protein BST95_01345 [Halioglobus japonicus]|uniref:Uncharacterized protein n=1 Tax=Halioglobus japonicus TaxID=930805 RepID=A0AAP8MC13_9GAMM|nr:hypothetical protein [Halioglobus japonicus]AQA17059.1 hypothetical protein BST95_01345 [Halioglobus japonicus]PLW84966.1 hypothetical protein C0029_15605 [Halioglobus japonicus]GHD18774.1 hypothetical protein GCM10007052_26480 [Halioglobus japonicus]